MIKFEGAKRPTDGVQGIAVYEDNAGNSLNPVQYYWVDGLITDYALNVVSGVFPSYASVKNASEAECSKDYEVMVVRLNGNLSNVATPREEGIAITASDEGNTFTIPAETYFAYTIKWLGDTEQDAVLNWNDLSYRAGIGNGSASYEHSPLPLREFTGHLGKQDIIIEATTDAFLELRFTRKI